MTRVDVLAALGLCGQVLRLLAATLALPLVVAVYYGDPWVPFVVTGLVAIAAGTVLVKLAGDREVGAAEGLLMVALTWLLVAVVGALPYLIAAHGIGPWVAPTTPTSTLGSPVNALFESMSGFTTTGATVLGQIDTGVHGHAMLLWRQLTQWLGGMGIVVLAVAILPQLSVGGAQLMAAEAPGPTLQKLTPRIRETALALWKIYAAITAIEILLLLGVGALNLDPAMTPYNALTHGLTTMPTGGFSQEARSIEAFSMVTQLVIIPFMFLAGTSFPLMWHVLHEGRSAFDDVDEFRSYVLTLVGVTAILSVILTIATTPATATMTAMVDATFQALAIVTTTGYASVDFAAWPMGAQVVLLVAMFIGGSTGSTAGGIKLLRWYLIIKAIRRELFTSTHPRAVRPVRLNGEPVDEDALQGVQSMTLMYLVVCAVGISIIAIDVARAGMSATGLELVSVGATAIGNVGPAFGQFGPMGSFLELPVVSKLVMVALMWFGRLEVIPVLVLLTRTFWRS